MLQLYDLTKLRLNRALIHASAMYAYIYICIHCIKCTYIMQNYEYKAIMRDNA
jgi:hypothetical protein